MKTRTAVIESMSCHMASKVPRDQHRNIAKERKALKIKDGYTWATFQGETFMEIILSKETFELDIQIEELELKIAPDGGETVLALPGVHHSDRPFTLQVLQAPRVLIGA